MFYASSSLHLRESRTFNVLRAGSDRELRTQSFCKLSLCENSQSCLLQSIFVPCLPTWYKLLVACQPDGRIERTPTMEASRHHSSLYHKVHWSSK